MAEPKLTKLELQITDALWREVEALRRIEPIAGTSRIEMLIVVSLSGTRDFRHNAPDLGLACSGHDCAVAGAVWSRTRCGSPFQGGTRWSRAVVTADNVGAFVRHHTRHLGFCGRSLAAEHPRQTRCPLSRVHEVILGCSRITDTARLRAAFPQLTWRSFVAVIRT